MATIQKSPMAIPPSEPLEDRFQRLANAWQKTVAHLSSTSKRENHPAYKEIIALGPAVVPLLLRDLETNHRNWFTALAKITGADPIPDEDVGKIRTMADAWLKWGGEKGYR